jgi:hypothetical protein
VVAVAAAVADTPNRIVQPKQGHYNPAAAAVAARRKRRPSGTALRQT